MDRREINQKWYKSFNEKEMTITFMDNEGDEKVVPAIFTVCGTCDGKGKHVNPSIDSHGLSAEDFDMDPDFEEDYFRGCYDVPCNECHGNRVSPEVNMERLTFEEKAEVNERIDEWFSWQHEMARERELGL